MMDLDRISTFEKILVELRDVIQESEEFKGLEVYFNDSEMNPNVPLPCVSFKVGQKEVLDSSALCTEYSRRIEIRLHTETLDERKLQSELYSYEEQLVSVIQDAKLNGRKEANQFNMIFFSNLLRVRFVIRYSI